MSTSHLPHAVLSRHHGIHIVARSATKPKSIVVTATMAYKVAAAGAALLLLLTVC